MRKVYLFRSVLIVLTLTFSSSVFAQRNVSGLIKAGPDDATKLTAAYLNPLFKGLGVGLNSGWNNTAHSKNAGRFEFRLGITGTFVPASDNQFDVTKIGLSSHVRPANPSEILAPTLSANKSSGPQMDVYDDDNNKVESFTMPKGQNLPIIPAPQLQATIGLPKGIDLSIRAVPKVNIGNDFGSLSMFGAGAKVELIPLIAGKTIDKVIPVDIAVAFGYSQFNYKLPLDVQAPSGSVPKDGNQNQDFSNQMIDATFSGMNAEAIISKKLLFFTPFLSVGYNTSKTKADMLGNYPVVTGGTLISKTYTTFTDPVHLNRDDIQGLKSTIGFQMNLAVLRLYGSYSVGEYNSANVGIGIGLGK
ncbi:MAG: DUF6588 family protein [Daejeonella sp.]